MIIHIVKKYLWLAEKNLVDPFPCPEDEDHGRLYANQDLDEKVFLYCIYCNYKNYLGYTTLKSISEQVLQEEIDSDLRHSLQNSGYDVTVDE
jgi:hypothetical protein